MSPPPPSGGEGKRKGPPGWVNATAGAIAGGVSRFCVGPLDVIKIRFQVQLEPTGTAAVKAIKGKVVPKYTNMGQAMRVIVREEGIKGLWRGTVPAQLLTVPYTAIQFITVAQFQHIIGNSHLRDSVFAPTLSYVGGAVAGVAATVGSYPFDVLRTTLAAQGEPKVYNTMREAYNGIVASQGVRGLYAGLGPTLVEIIPYSALQFGLYDALNRGWTRQRAKREGKAVRDVEATSMQRFMCGLMAGMVGKVGTHPLDVVKKRFQVAGLHRSSRYGRRVERDMYKSMWDCLRKIYLYEGVAGMYKGVAPAVVKAAPAAAITFTVYELALAAIVANLPPREE